ncbi:hypothetical protein [Microbulbifer discodermiae]|uniref:hypothetical protein n=1 Tax=Microbulbifer sp. 2201CG32-9 TaxID=3232309 RepID=UPI00345C61CB
MSGRKHKNRQRGQRREQPTELLRELSALQELLGSGEAGDIPLLDQVADKPRAGGSQGLETEPDKAPKTPTANTPVPESPQGGELPVLFAQVGGTTSEDSRAELSATERALLRPLQDLRKKAESEKPPSADTKPGAPPKGQEQQELFQTPPAPAAEENPFLPAHIRARLSSRQPDKTPTPVAAVASGDTTERRPQSSAEPVPLSKGASPPAEHPKPETGETALVGPPAPAESVDQRRQLVDRLVARQLPELERQLRARIEMMVDELEAQG